MNNSIKNKSLVNSLNQIIDYFNRVGIKSTNGLVKITWFTVNPVKYNPDDPAGFSVKFDKHLDEFVCELTGYMDPILMMEGIGWEVVENSNSIYYCVYDPSATHFSNIQELKFLTYKSIEW